MWRLEIRRWCNITIFLLAQAQKCIRLSPLTKSQLPTGSSQICTLRMIACFLTQYNCSPVHNDYIRKTCQQSILKQEVTLTGQNSAHNYHMCDNARPLVVVQSYMSHNFDGYIFKSGDKSDFIVKYFNEKTTYLYM